MNKRDKVESSLKNKTSNINIVDERGLSLTHYAVITNDLDLLKMLKEYGCDLNLKDLNGNLPIHHVYNETENKKKIPSIIKLLIKAGNDINCFDRFGIPPLHKATRMRNYIAVKALLENGAEANIIDKKSKSTALHRAVIETGAGGTGGMLDIKMDIIKVLIKHGVKSNIKNKNGKTAVDLIKTKEIIAMFEKK